MNKITLFVVGLVAGSFTTPAMSSPEQPTLIETAAFLITGKRAGEFKVLQDERMLERDLKSSSQQFAGPETFLEILNSKGRYEHIGNPPGQESDCTISRFYTDEEYKPPYDASKIKYAEWYAFNKLNGDRKLDRKYNEFTEKYEEFETLIGNQAYCFVDLRSNKDNKVSCTDNIVIKIPEGSSEIRMKAWNYLYSNYCKLTNQPF